MVSDEVVMSLDGQVIEGNISISKLKLVMAWVVIHSDELMANWRLLSEGREYFKIDPLR